MLTTTKVDSPRIVVAESEGLVRDVVAMACASDDMEIVGETTNGAALVALCKLHRPDVAVSGIDLDDGAIEAHVTAILGTDAKLLVLSDDRSDTRMTWLLAHGASGYLFHESGLEEVIDAVRAVARGTSPLHPRAADVVLRQWRRLQTLPTPAASRRALTPRELEVLTALAEGLASKAIARRFGVSLKTIENHKTNIFSKLGVASTAHAVAVAIADGLVQATVDRGPIPHTAWGSRPLGTPGDRP